MSNYVELFSGHAGQYAKARPRYPAALFEWIASAAPARRVAWDCATGNGQAATSLADWFERVIATDASDAQLTHAVPHPRITYRQARAEASGLESASIDVVTVAQALHWLDLPAFFEEVRRVLVPGGIIVVWAYALPRITPGIDTILDRLYDGTLEGYWSERRALVDEGYRSVEMPFEELSAPPFQLRMDWTLDEFAAYVRTWSAVQRYIRDGHRDPVDRLVYDLRPLWGQPHERRPVTWTFSVRAGRR